MVSRRLSPIVALFVLWCCLVVTATVAAQNAGGAEDPLVKVLVNKGVLTPSEAQSLAGGSPAQQRDALAKLLKEKGILTDAEYNALAPAPVAAASQAPVIASAPAQVATKPPGPDVIPAVAPIRFLQVEGSPKGGVVPDIKLGSGAKMKIYGLIKASAIYDSSAPYGTDMPLPAFGPPGDTGPDGSSEFHMKARFARVGTNFEWPDVSPNLTLTGKLEADFEGNFTRVLNRNISTIRSSQFSIRLAYGRLDYKATDKTTLYALFGQDWTPFGSSTLPAIFETTGLGLGFGTLDERAPQFRFGFDHNFGGERKWHFEPEFAVVMPAYGDDPADVANQLGYGERQGADAARPDVEGRLVTQFQLDPAKGVVPAQLILSFVQGERTADVLKKAVPLCDTCADPKKFQSAFPNGASASTERWGYSAEAQLPTRYVTVLLKYWRGADLRWFFVSDLLSAFNDNGGLTNTAFAPSVDGPAAADCKIGTPQCVLFGLRGGMPVIAPQQPVRSQGGFVNLGFPLGRIFGADPEGHNAGWQLYLHYAYDGVFASDARRIGDVGSRNDLAAATLYYKLNNWLSFVNELSMYRTRTVDGISAGSPLLRGTPAREWHDNRYEVGPIFTF